MSTYTDGLKRIEEVLGVSGRQSIENFANISPDFSKYIIEFAYGDLYQRPLLNDKTREVASLSSIVTQGNFGAPLRLHLNGMLNVGWSEAEVLEVLIYLVGYVGFPSIVEAMKVAKEVFDSRKK